MAYSVPRVQIVPQPDDQVSFTVDGRERLRWHHGTQHPRPFFYPLIGPSGRPVIRMGHPDASNHDHHRGLWWGFREFAGLDAWEEHRRDIALPQIKQEQWLHYQDGAEEVGILVRIGWHDDHRVALMKHEMAAMLRPLPEGETWLEIQATFTTALPKVELGKTNFGFLGLRVANSLSAKFGGGRLTNSDGLIGEKAIIAKPARWVDFSGPILNGVEEGVTAFDHPTNPRHPTSWHVRDDGWYCPAFCLREGYTLTSSEPLRLRYGFHVHRAAGDAKRANESFERFAATAAWEYDKKRPFVERLKRNTV